MPSIEIVSVGQKRPARFRDVPFAVVSEGGHLRSRRHPSRFQRDFDRLDGSIYHLGCPHLRRNRSGVFEAYELLSGKCRNLRPRAVFLEFDRAYIAGIRRLMTALLAQSPVGRVIFTSDYEFSPSRTKRVGNISMRGFWALHRRKRLRFNALYVITRGLDNM